MAVKAAALAHDLQTVVLVAWQCCATMSMTRKMVMQGEGQLTCMMRKMVVQEEGKALKPKEGNLRMASYGLVKQIPDHVFFYAV